MDEPEGPQEGFVLTCGDCGENGLDHQGVEVITLQETEAVVSCRVCEVVLMRLKFSAPLDVEPKPIARLH